MATIPPFDSDGLLPPSDYELSLDELRGSILVAGPGDPTPIHRGTDHGESDW